MINLILDVIDQSRYLVGQLRIHPKIPMLSPSALRNLVAVLKPSVADAIQSFDDLRLLNILCVATGSTHTSPKRLHTPERCDAIFFFIQ